MKLMLLFILPNLITAAACQTTTVKTNPSQSGNNADTIYHYRHATRDGTGKYFLGREIAQVMGAAGSDWLERPERQSEENTDLAIENMKLRTGAVVADIGAGTGYYTFRIAEKLTDGKVYAVELQDELINYLQNKIKETKAINVEVVKGDTLGVHLPDGSIDLAIMVDVYHELSWPKEVLHAIRRCLKPDGKLLLIEYRGEDPKVPIKPVHKMTVQQIDKEMSSTGFVSDYRGNFLPIQHFLLYRKQNKN